MDNKRENNQKKVRISKQCSTSLIIGSILVISLPFLPMGMMYLLSILLFLAIFPVADLLVKEYEYIYSPDPFHANKYGRLWEEDYSIEYKGKIINYRHLYYRSSIGVPEEDFVTTKIDEINLERIKEKYEQNR